MSHEVTNDSQSCLLRSDCSLHDHSHMKCNEHFELISTVESLNGIAQTLVAGCKHLVACTRSQYYSVSLTIVNLCHWPGSTVNNCVIQHSHY